MHGLNKCCIFITVSHSASLILAVLGAKTQANLGVQSKSACRVVDYFRAVKQPEAVFSTERAQFIYLFIYPLDLQLGAFSSTEA